MFSVGVVASSRPAVLINVLINSLSTRTPDVWETSSETSQDLCHIALTPCTFYHQDRLLLRSKLRTHHVCPIQCLCNACQVRQALGARAHTKGQTKGLLKTKGQPFSQCYVMRQFMTTIIFVVILLKPSYHYGWLCRSGWFSHYAHT